MIYRLTKDDIHEGRKAINILGSRNARFVAVERGSKGSNKMRKGWNEPENTLSWPEALSMYEQNWNIGLASGSANIYAFDFDADSLRGHECTQLAGTLYTYRENAGDRAKFFFICKDKLPRRSAKNGVELLGWTREDKHWLAVLAGVHPSGVPIRWGGHQLVELDKDTVEALYEEWTGAELFRQPRERRALEPGSADLEIVADALSHIDAWDLDYNTWIGILGALHDEFGDNAYELACEWGQEGVEERWDSFGNHGDGATVASIYYLAAQRGWQRPADSFCEELQQTRRWLHTATGAESIKEAGLRVSTGIKILDALYEICDEWNKRTVWPGLRTWATRAAVNYKTLQNAISKLDQSGLISVKSDDYRGAVLQITPTLSKLDQYSTSTNTLDTNNGKTTDPVLITYAEHRRNDLFRNNHAAYKKRNPDALKPLGESCLLAISLLADGEKTVREVADERGMSTGTMRRALYKAHKMGIVDKDKSGRAYSFSLLPEWRDTIKTLMRNVTSYGVHLRRELQTAEAKLQNARKSGDDKRIQKAEATYNQWAFVLTDKENPAQWVGDYRPGYRWQQWDKAEEEQELAQVVENVRELSATGLDPAGIRRAMQYAGYDDAAVSRALARREAVAA